MSLVLPLTCTTGCAKRYSVVDGGEQICLPKATVDQLYKDNSDLLAVCGRQ